jgi:hypothetical protein
MLTESTGQLAEKKPDLVVVVVVVVHIFLWKTES